MSWELLADHLVQAWFRTNQYSHLTEDTKTVTVPPPPPQLYLKKSRDLKRCTWNSWPTCKATSFQRPEHLLFTATQYFPLQNHPFTCCWSPWLCGSGFHTWFKRLDDPGLSQSVLIFPSHWLVERWACDSYRANEVFQGNSGKLSLAVKWEGCEPCEGWGC